MKAILFSIIAWSTGLTLYFIAAIITGHVNIFQWSVTARVTSVILWIVVSIFITALFPVKSKGDLAREAREYWAQNQNL